MSLGDIPYFRYKTVYVILWWLTFSGLYGKDDEEKTDIDIVVETTEEAFLDIGKLWGLPEDKKVFLWQLCKGTSI